MEFLSKNKSSLAAAVVLLIAIFAYRYWSSSSIEVPAVAGSQEIGSDILKLSHDLSAANLNTPLFSSPAYINLSDFSITLQEQPVGRPNPFDVIGRD